MRILYHFKTYIPKTGVWVSTVAWDMRIGGGRTSETMVFKGDEKDIIDWSDIDFESLGYIQNETVLMRKHNEMVEKWSNKS